MSLSAADRADLRQLVDGYADAVDRRDAAALVGLFTAGAEMVVAMIEGGDPHVYRGAEIAAIIDAVAAYDRTFHLVGGAVFEGDGGSATGRVQCLAHHYERGRSGPTDLVMMICYDDFYARLDAGWRIERRRLTLLWTELHPALPVRRATRPGGG